MKAWQLFWIKKGWGYIDKTGEIIIPAKYHRAEPFHNGLAAVYLGEIDTWQFIDKNGKVVKDNIFPGRDKKIRFNEGLASIPEGDGVPWGVIDTKGKWVIKPEFDLLTPFNEGVAFAIKGDKIGFINKKGEWVLDLYGKSINETFPVVTEGLIAAKKNDKWGFVDIKGKWVVEPKYNSVWYFTEGLASVCDDRDNWGVINKKGEWVVKPMTKNMLYPFKNGYAVVGTDAKLWGVIDKTGKWAVEPVYADIDISPVPDVTSTTVKMNYDGMFTVEDAKTGKKGYINIKDLKK